MKALAIRLYQNWAEKLSLVASYLILFLLGFLCLTFLSRLSITSGGQQHVLSLVLFSFFIPIILSWIGSRIMSLAFFLPAAIAFSILTSWTTGSLRYLLFVPAYGLLTFLLFYLDQQKNSEVIVRKIEIERAINKKNDVELTFQEEGTTISVFFEKYTSYYNLRNLAAEFSTTLSLKELSQMIVSKTMELIPQGNSCLLFLAEAASGSISLVASKSVELGGEGKEKSGAVFDYWILRNRQSLIVVDTQRDFRFDLKKASGLDGIRSVIAAPLIYAGKVAGTLRMNASKAAAFATDDLRLLDAISTLASSAISNAILFKKTEELAIHDSLTGLYVQRYFLERLSEEHQRGLLMNTPLTLLMCDLDHFKDCNDRYGHGIGDFVLTKISELLTEKASHGIVARYGGEEFSILLPKVNFQEGCRLAESIRSAVVNMNLTVRREMIPMTISIGAASVPSDTRDAEELIRIADERLYEAKSKGRNRVWAGE
ncbi:MAG: diguanylate cyclase [Candidatus Omnitrophica bacterium]|nr:diguanylate cyclase [Candidatus Omnitrophota bacterium]